ncbi:MAG: hypothetical protein HF314_10935 [Ignavibacteria bacterium]|jgi:nitrogen fixation protein FixH|nr:hypothetical protein [Ignavibacteria bacterium]MCU7503581.1 hypothetical protein [Ignavibacteria bacterium]MCU7516765.1 hypothetical protein [Ignavibacteria bacterium]
MKLHWGLKIFFLFGAFILGIVSMVAFYMGQEIDLVSKEYYNDEINYQEKLDKLKRTRLLKENVKFTFSGENVRITFPKAAEKVVSGKIHFYRPSDSNCDFSFPVQVDSEYNQSVDFHGREKGLWKIEMNWKNGNSEYLEEEMINIH